MIPYEDLTFYDWDWYWGQSIMFAKLEGRWRAVRPVTRDENYQWHQLQSKTLEDLASEGETLLFKDVLSEGSTYSVAPLTPFESKDWITYEPQLGYFLNDDDSSLMFVVPNAPRSKAKGFCTAKIQIKSPVDSAALPRAYRSAMLTGYSRSTNGSMRCICRQILARLNDGFPPSWKTAVLESNSSKGGKCTSVILSPAIAVSLDGASDSGVLLFSGTLLGTIHIQIGRRGGSSITLTPRTKPKSQLERNAIEWISLNLNDNQRRVS